jgi:DNA polymerase-3 subunit beta
MKVQFSRPILADALATVKPAVKAKPAQPILKGIKIEVHDQVATVTATDQSTSITTRIPCDESSDIAASDGTIIVPGQMLDRLIATLPKKPVIFTANASSLQINCDTSTASIPLMTVEDYPPLPDAPTPVGTMNGHDLTRAIAAVAAASSTDDTLPMLTGVKLTAEDGSLTITATDRFRIHHHTLEWDGDNMDALVPAAELKDAAKMIGSQPVTVLSDGRRFGFRFGDTQIITRHIDSDFPKFRSLFPKMCTTAVQVNRQAVTDAVKRVSALADATAPIRMEFSHGEVEITANDRESWSTKETTPCGLMGSPMVIGMNPGYFTGTMASVTEHAADNVVLCIGSSGRSIVVLPDVEVEEAAEMTVPTSDRIALVMPVRLPG